MKIDKTFLAALLTLFAFTNSVFGQASADRCRHMCAFECNTWPPDEQAWCMQSCVLDCLMEPESGQYCVICHITPPESRSQNNQSKIPNHFATSTLDENYVENVFYPITQNSPSYIEKYRPDHNARQQLKSLLDQRHSAGLSTLDPISGYPFSSVVDFVKEDDRSLIFFMSNISIHARNINYNKKVSLIISDIGQRGAHLRPRATLVGQVNKVSAGKSYDRARELYLEKYPEYKEILDLPDTFLYRFYADAIMLNGGAALNGMMIDMDTIQ